MPPTRISMSLLLCFALAGCQTHAASPAPGLGSSVVPGATDPSRNGLHANAAACDVSGAKAAIKAAPAAVDAADRDGMTPLALAARAGCLPVVSALVAAGAQPDAVEERSGWTPLHHAAAQRHAAVVDYLLAHGAHQERKTRAGQTPLGLALVTAPRYYAPTGPGDRHMTEMVLLSGKARRPIGAATPAVAMKSPAKKKAPAKKPAVKKPVAKKKAAAAPAKATSSSTSSARARP
jgi:hypothetical protein